MKKKKITHKSSIPAKKDANPGSPFRDEFVFHNKKVRVNFVEKLAQDLERAALEDPEFLILSDFWQQRGLRHTTIENWRGEFPCLENAIQEAKIAIGNRRLKGGFKKILSEKLVERTMHIYDPELRASEEWRAKLKLDNEGQSSTKIVVIEKYPELDKNDSRDKSTSK